MVTIWFVSIESKTHSVQFEETGLGNQSNARIALCVCDVFMVSSVTCVGYYLF